MSQIDIYKRIPTQKVRNKTTSNLSSQEETAVNGILTRFRQYFIAKHSS